MHFHSDFQSQVKEALAKHGFSCLAVRSSAVTEDLATRSFAGVYDSFIDVSCGSTLESIRKCWISGFSFRALKYLSRNPDALSFEMAVIVQEMMHFEVSGVAFTVDPIGRRYILIEAAAVDTPEPIVSGRIVPTRYLFDRYFDLVDKSADASLPPSLLRHVAELSLVIERECGSPQDIEFGVRGGRVLFLQARPITTIMPHDVP